MNTVHEADGGMFLREWFTVHIVNTTASSGCPFAIPTHHCALAEDHTTPHQMVQTVQTLSGVRQG